MQPGPGQPPPGSPHHDGAVQPLERPVRGRLLLLPRLLHAGAGERGRRWDPRNRTRGESGGGSGRGSVKGDPPGRVCFDPRVQRWRAGGASPGSPALPPLTRSRCGQRERGEPSTGSGGRAWTLCRQGHAAKATTSPRSSALTGKKVSAGSPHLSQTS